MNVWPKNMIGLVVALPLLVSVALANESETQKIGF
jgi:hypothetical protein